jgi:deoxyribonuclease V
MILAVDAYYTHEGSTTAGVAFENWESAMPTHTFVSKLPTVAEYTPGKFYQRELPCILDLLRAHSLQPDLILIDGYVYLDGIAQPGLGKHLFDALEGEVPVIGIAKTSFAGIGPEFQVLRGSTSIKPLFVTSVGQALSAAKAGVQRMHGIHRIPTLLKAADQLCRQHPHPGTLAITCATAAVSFLA